MWRKVRLTIASVVGVLSFAYAIADYFGVTDKLSGREVAFLGLTRLSSTKGFPEVIIFSDEKEFLPVLKFILDNTKDQQTLDLIKQGKSPSAIVRLGGTISVPGAGDANVDYDPRFVLDSSPIFVGYHYHRDGAEKGIPDEKRIGRPVGNLRELKMWIDNSKTRERFLVSSILIGILSLLVVGMEWRAKE
jgi:hypothetical protein